MFSEIVDRFERVQNSGKKNIADKCKRGGPDWEEKKKEFPSQGSAVVQHVPQKDSGAAQGFVWPGRGRQDAELSAKEGPSQVGQPGDDDSLQGQRRRAWTP